VCLWVGQTQSTSWLVILHKEFITHYVTTSEYFHFVILRAHPRPNFCLVSIFEIGHFSVLSHLGGIMLVVNTDNTFQLILAGHLVVMQEKALLSVHYTLDLSPFQGKIPNKRPFSYKKKAQFNTNEINSTTVPSNCNQKSLHINECCKPTSMYTCTRMILYDIVGKFCITSLNTGIQHLIIHTWLLCSFSTVEYPYLWLMWCINWIFWMHFTLAKDFTMDNAMPWKTCSLWLSSWVINLSLFSK